MREKERTHSQSVCVCVCVCACVYVRKGEMTFGDPTSLAPHERLTDLAVVPREKPHTGAAAREQPRDSPVIER